MVNCIVVYRCIWSGQKLDEAGAVGCVGWAGARGQMSDGMGQRGENAGWGQGSWGCVGRGHSHGHSKADQCPIPAAYLNAPMPFLAQLLPFVIWARILSYKLYKLLLQKLKRSFSLPALFTLIATQTSDQTETGSRVYHSPASLAHSPSPEAHHWRGGQQPGPARLATLQ